MKVTSTDKILTRYWQTSYNHLEWKTREQQTNCEDENSSPPLLHSSRPPPPGERSGPIRGEITNSAGSLSNPTLTFLLRWKEENSRQRKNSLNRPRNNETEKATAISINASCNGWARVQKSQIANLIRNKPSFAILDTVRKFYALFNLIGATVTEESDNVHTNFWILILILYLLYRQSMAKRVLSSSVLAPSKAKMEKTCSTSHDACRGAIWSYRL